MKLLSRINKENQYCEQKEDREWMGLKRVGKNAKKELSLLGLFCPSASSIKTILHG